MLLPECPQTHLGCRWEARACANADTSRQKPARHPQTRAEAKKTPLKQPCKYPNRKNELVCTFAAP